MNVEKIKRKQRPLQLTSCHSSPGGQLILVPFAILSLLLLPCPQLSGGTLGLVGDSELDMRLYGL